MAVVGVRELRQNLSKYLVRIKAGESFVVTERGREVARLVPSGVEVDPLVELAATRGATLPTRRFGSAARVPVPADGPSVGELVAEQRRER
jgi:prevent-host-death family protein